jgi:hypothetical protein
VGEVVGVGVDLDGNALVLSDGEARFGAGAVSGQWFDSAGIDLTGEFHLLTSPSALPRLRKAEALLRLSPLIGGGLVVGDDSDWLAAVPAGATSAQPAPSFLGARAGAEFTVVRGRTAYAVIHAGRSGQCVPAVEVLDADGTSCGVVFYPVRSSSSCGASLTIGADGTIIQAMPMDMDPQQVAGNWRLASWRFWRGTLR